MKIRTNVKAGIGDSGSNHNEKMDVNNNDSFKSGKSIIKKLSLKKESIRKLKDSELKGIAGGNLRGYAPTSMGCATRPC